MVLEQSRDAAAAAAEMEATAKSDALAALADARLRITDLQLQARVSNGLLRAGHAELRHCSYALFRFATMPFGQAIIQTRLPGMRSAMFAASWQFATL